jgi:hypothetical protein
MEFLSVFSTIETASVVSTVPYLLLLFGGLLKYKLAQRRMKTLTAFIIPPNSDRNEMIEKFRSHSGYKNVYFFYPEDHVLKGSGLKNSEKSELTKHRFSDPITWENTMMPYIKDEMMKFIKTIKVSPKRLNVIILSSPNIAKFLNIRNVYSFISSNRLNKETIASKNREDSLLLGYIRGQFSKENSVMFQDADELFDVVEAQLEKISKKTGKKI